MVDVEKRAILAIEQSLILCPHLVTYISANDKTPLTDGFIIRYSGLGRRKEDITGRLDVQVKGRTVGTRTAPTTYSLNRGDLTAIRRHGTVLLFVVYLRPDGSRLGPPRYAILAPYTIDLLLDQTPRKQKSAAVLLRDLPENPAEMEAIVHIAILSQRQRMFEDVSGSVLEDGTSITIHATKQFSLDEPMTISPERGDFVVEVKTKVGTIPLPGVLELHPGSYREHPTDMVVRCGDVQFSNATVRQIDSRSHEVKPSGGITMRLMFEGERLQASSINLNLVDNLADRVRDIDFFLNLAQSRSIELNGSEYTFETSETHDVSDVRELRRNLGRLIALLEKLHVDINLVSLAEIDAAQHERLRYVYASLVQNKPIRADDANVAYVSEKLGSWQLSLFVLPAGEPGSWKYVDPFDPENRHQFKLYSVDDSGRTKEVTGTVYDGIKTEQLPRVVNLHLYALVDAYRTIAELPETSFLANQFVLKLIGAADAEPRRQAEFLGAADSLNSWLNELEPDSVPNVLNQFQIRARRPGGLSAEERKEIRALRRQIISSGASGAAVHETGCAVLLGDADDIRECAARLTQKEREDLESYPIWSLVPDLEAAVRSE